MTANFLGGDDTPLECAPRTSAKLRFVGLLRRLTSVGWKHGDSGHSAGEKEKARRKKLARQNEKRFVLTPTGLLMEGHYTYKYSIRLLFPRKMRTMAPVYLVSISLVDRSPTMTPEDRDRMIELCRRIARETDPKKLASWIEELKGIIQSKIRDLRDGKRGTGAA